jgi:HK97 family phage major capsid protein
LYVFAYVNDKLLRRAPVAASSILMACSADEFNFKIGAAIFGGDGAGKPLGFMNSPAVVDVSKETSQAAATINGKNINKMWARGHANWRSNAVWFINQDVEPALDELALLIGTAGAPLYLPAGGISGAPLATLKGRPVVPIEYAETRGDITLANLKAYRVGVRGGIDQQVSMHLKFDYAQTAFRFIMEIDGQSMLKDAITPFKGTGTLSPFVALATRS